MLNGPLMARTGCAFCLCAHAPPGCYPFGLLAFQRGDWVAGVFLVRLVRGRGDGALAGAASASVLRSWVSCSARRWFSVRAVSRSVSARSARMRRASRVSSRAVMRALGCPFWHARGTATVGVACRSRTDDLFITSATAALEHVI